MALETHSLFYYGIDVTNDNRYLDFDEGGGELTATLPIGTFTPSDLARKIKIAMDSVGSLSYSVYFDRALKTLTISSTSNFSLLLQSGTNVNNSIFKSIGFNGGVDLTGSSSYSGESFVSEYRTQFIIQDYVKNGFSKKSIQSTVNQSASGVVEVVRFGKVSFVDMSFYFITDKNLSDGYFFRYNPNGVQDMLNFLDYLTNKKEIEFMEDESNVNSFLKLLLEKTPESESGVDFKLKEEVQRGLPGVYKTGTMTFRVLE